MSAPPYMKLYWADYHQDTRHLTRDEHGAYFLLLGEAWNRGGFLPDDDALLARWVLATPEEWARLKPIVMGFFKASTKGRWRHKRISEELAAYDDVSRKRKAAGKRGGSSTRGKDSEKSEANATAIAQHKPAKPEPEPEPEPDTQKKDLLGMAPQRGSRIPVDWDPGDLGRAYAVSKGFTPIAIENMAEKFRNYWTAKTGQAATKRDWYATWRNWVIEESERHPQQAQGRAPSRVGGIY